MSWFGRFVTILLLPILGIGLAFSALELGFRVIAGWKSVEVRSDRPSFYYTPDNARSFQGPRHKKRKDQGVFRIAVVGDSFTFGPDMQFDDVFPARLERMLNLNSEAQRVEVLNYGVPAYSTSHEILEVRRAVAEQADMVVLQITLNDAQLKPFRPTRITREGGFSEISAPEGFLRHSKLASFVVTRLQNEDSHRRYVEYYHDLFKRKGSWDLFQTSIEKIAQYSKRKQVRLVAVVFPLFGLALDENYPFHDIHHKIEALLEENSVPFLDLFEAYRGMSLERLQLIPGKDFHPNEIGHRIAAEAIYTWLADKGYLPAERVARGILLERKSPVFSSSQKAIFRPKGTRPRASHS